MTFFSVSGRIGRADYWLGNIVLGGIGMFLMLVPIFLFPGPWTIGGALLVAIPIWVSSLTFAIRRVHDRDRSGMFLLVFWGLPQVLGALASAVDSEGWLAAVLGLTGLGIGLWGSVELYFLRGTIGPNRFGVDPV